MKMSRWHSWIGAMRRPYLTVKRLKLPFLTRSLQNMSPSSYYMISYLDIKILQLREMPVEWEGLPAMAVEVELDVEEASRTVNDPDVLTFLMDEAVQTFNSKGQHSWVGCKYL